MTTTPATTATALIGAATAYTTTPAAATYLQPAAEIFDGVTFALFLCGALGGLGYWLADPARKWRNLWAKALLGGIVGAGLNFAAVLFLSKEYGVEIAPDDNALRIMGTAAFVLGFIQESVVELTQRMLGKGKTDDEE